MRARWALLLLAASYAAADRAPAAAAAAAPAQSAYYDVVVYGSTPGGIMAAVAAANESARVALVSPTAHVGGMTASGLGQTDIGDAAVVGGLAATFFDTVCALYNKTGPCYTYEPHVAEAAFWVLLRSQRSLTVLLSTPLVGVARDGTTLASITVAQPPSSGGGTATIGGGVFIDASYEGDLLAAANVSFAWGREGVDTYAESLAGRLFVPNACVPAAPPQRQRRLTPRGTNRATPHTPHPPRAAWAATSLRCRSTTPTAAAACCP